MGSEVATASTMPSPPNSTRAGTIKKPPPTPRKPVNTPTPSPAITARSQWTVRTARDAGALVGRNISAAMTSMRAAKSSRSTTPGSRWVNHEPA